MPELELPATEPSALADSREQVRDRGAGLLRNVLTGLILAVAIGGIVWLFARPGEAESSQAVSLSATSSGPAPRIGKPAPDFRVFQLDGTTAQLSDFRGRPVWLSFWATWCPPCRSESPEIEAASKEYAAAGVVVLAVDLGEDPRTVQGYAQKAGLSYLIGLDKGTQVAALYHVAGLPNHFFIDSDGVIRDRRIGRLGREGIAKSLSTILPAASRTQAGVANPTK